MLILLPPSEGKTHGGTGKWDPNGGKFGQLLGERRVSVAHELTRTSDAALKVRGKTAEHAREVNRGLLRGPVMPAWERYNGVVYQGLDLASLPARARASVNKRMLVLSGLFGLITLADEIPDYRAPMDAKLNELGPLTTFWEPMLTPLLTSISKREVVVVLLPQVHRKAITPPTTKWVRVELVSKQGVGGHAAKFAKGRLARWLIEHDFDDLTSWRDDGWRARFVR